MQANGPKMPFSLSQWSWFRSNYEEYRTGKPQKVACTHEAPLDGLAPLARSCGRGGWFTTAVVNVRVSEDEAVAAWPAARTSLTGVSEGKAAAARTGRPLH